MASTPKVVRRTAKRIRREVSNYFGFPVRARVNFGADNSSITSIRGGKAKGVISLDREMRKVGRIPMARAELVLRHEFFHVAGDSYMLKKVSNTIDLSNEAIAMVGSAENEISRLHGPNAYRRVLADYDFALRINPPRDFVHLAGLKIMLNILRKYPSKKERQKFIQELLIQNAEAVKEGQKRNVDAYIVNPFGKIILQQG